MEANILLSFPDSCFFLNHATSVNKRKEKKFFVVKRLHDFSPKNHINLERLTGISAHLILDGHICLSYR